MIRNLREYSNVAPDKFRILGVSNGGALALRALLLELPDAGLETVVCVVSSLHNQQYRDGVFYRPADHEDTSSSADNNGYDMSLLHSTGRKCLLVQNTNDTVIPYNGGSGGVPNTVFYAAQFSAWVLAWSLKGILETSWENCRVSSWMIIPTSTCTNILLMLSFMLEVMLDMTLTKD